MTHWAHNNTNLIGQVVLTRYVDHAANSDKYRRFLVVWDSTTPANKVLITHTGRWTAETARNIWTGGTYRLADDGTKQVDQRISAGDFLNKLVSRKLGNYTRGAIANLTPNQIMFAMSQVAASLPAGSSGTPPTVAGQGTASQKFPSVRIATSGLSPANLSRAVAEAKPLKNGRFRVVAIHSNYETQLNESTNVDDVGLMRIDEGDPSAPFLMEGTDGRTVWALSIEPHVSGVNMTAELAAQIGNIVDTSLARPSESAPADRQVEWLLGAARQGGSDQMEMLTEYAKINQLVAAEQERISRIADDLALALATIIKGD